MVAVVRWTAMEKQLQQDSISSVGVGMGKEYPPSESFASEPPPAYQRPRATAVQIARIAAGTVIAVTFILGFFMLASAYITATMSCTTFNNLEALRQELEEQPQYQHLVAVDPLQSEESQSAEEAKGQNLVAPPPPAAPASNPQPAPAPAVPQQPLGDFSTPIQIKLPLTLDFDDLAGALVEKNQRSRMNCVVEKRRAEEVMDHQPKTVRLPFGVNLTTDPRYEHVTGERMAIFCESGNDQRHVPVDNSIATPVVMPMPFHHGAESMHLIPIPMPMPHQMPHQMPPQMGPQMGPQMQMQPQMMRQAPPPPPHQLFHPPPPPPQQPHPAQTQAVPLPMELLARIAQEAQEEAGDGKDDAPVHIIAREEIFPIFHPANPEGRSLNAAPVPAEMVQPPPPPPYAPRHLPLPPQPQHMQTTQLHPANDEPTRPHYVQPRSVRSVEDAFLKRDKRVKRCACDCSC